MRSFASLLATGLVALAFCAWAIHAGDRSISVPPPDVRVEDFVHLLSAGRFDQAANFLSIDESHTPSEDLRDFWSPVKERLGEVTDIQGETRSMSQDRAIASADVRSGKGEMNREFSLHFEKGQWRIDEFSAGQFKPTE